jgi:hypothetical protein
LSSIHFFIFYKLGTWFGCCCSLVTSTTYLLYLLLVLIVILSVLISKLTRQQNRPSSLITRLTPYVVKNQISQPRGLLPSPQSIPSIAFLSQPSSSLMDWQRKGGNHHSRKTKPSPYFYHQFFLPISQICQPIHSTSGTLHSLYLSVIP